jgi:3-oxoadipate enol-lactonase
MPRARLNGIEVHYELSGSGHRLLFLNGTGATLAQMAPVVSLFAKTFEVLAFDQRGIGQSSAPSEPYAMADLADDALALADQLGWDHFHLIGISFGGMVAQEMAVTAPERVDRLALLCTSPGGAGGSSFPFRSLLELTLASRVTVSAEIMDTRFTPEWLQEHESDRFLAGVLAQRFSPEAFDEERGTALQLDARSEHDVFDRLPRISCPTLVASGRFDGIAPPANGAAIASQIPRGELRLFEGGHAFIGQDPESLPAIVRFLSSE